MCKTSKTNTSNKNLSRVNLLNHPEQVNKTWDVLLDGVCIGSIHGQSRLEAEETIAVWRMKGLTIAPTTFKA